MSRDRGKNFITSGLGRTGHSLTGKPGTRRFMRYSLRDDLFNNRGNFVVHEVAITCPSCKEADDNPVINNLNCPLCDGDGFVFRDPKEIQVLIANVRYSRDLEDIGWVVPGDCVMSVNPNFNRVVSDFDRITFTWPENVGSGQVITRGFLHREFPLKYLVNEDRLHYSAADVLHCEDEDGNIYKADSDFSIDNKIIRWGENKPIVNKRYTIKYKAYFEWLVFNPAAGRRDNGEDLGSRFILRKKHVVWTKENPKSTPKVERVNSFFGEVIDL